MKVLSLCSGYGGLELALDILFPGQVQVTAVCDSYRPARIVLARRFPHAVQYPDVADPLIELESADIVTFGFPCQDLSRAGKGAGLRGSRSSLFFRCAEIGNLSGAGALVIENVPQALKHRGTIEAELLRYGFVARWGRAKASEAGLPHRRDRVFVVAARRRGVLPLPPLSPVPPEFDHPPEMVLPTPTVVDMGWGRTEDEWDGWRTEQRAKHGNGNGHGQSLFQALGRPEPGVACRCMESMMGLQRGWVTGLGLSISAQRRLLGNGVAPAQGALGIYRAITSPIDD